ncbi:MAG: TonB-dependent receptor [Alphaproteobacteria bacterium]|nr:TonB-dependent receptor [Alphaproteobacteria bacterium]
MRFHALLGGVALPALAFAMAVPAMAQSVSSSIRGTVVDGEGFAVPNASVEVRNDGNGQVKRMTSSTGGFFTASGLSVGDTYTVSVTADGYKPKQITGVRLALGEALRLDVEMTASATAGEEVTVVGVREANPAIDARGVGTQFDAEAIAQTTSMTRDVHDVVAQSPLAYIDPSTVGDSLSIAGSNPRCSSFLVDGLPQNDSFGLNFNGYPTARSPLPFDWSQQVQLAVSPYDVEYNDFCGGVINVVTKTGSNDFHGSAYYYHKDDSLIGDRSKGDEYSFDFREKNYGATFSGPIIEDTLFFFLGYDKVERTTPVSIGPGKGATAGSFATQIGGISQSEIDQVMQIAQDVYGYDAIAIPSGFDEENERYAAKISWNITDAHRAQFSYSHAEGGTLSFNHNNTSTTLPQIGLGSNYYLDSEKLDSYSLQVFSDWTDNFSTELRIGRVEIDAAQSPLGGTEFPEIAVRTPGLDNVQGNADDGYVWLGPDQFRHFNVLDTTFDIVKLTGTYTLDRHVITGGYERKMLDIFNGFVQGSLGQYRFDSIADFANGLLAAGPDSRLSSGRGQQPIRYANAGSNNPADASADWGYNINSLYIQDDFDVTDHLTVMAGLRYDWYESEGSIKLNQGFLDAYGFPNTKTLEGLDIWLPRASFSYAVPTEDEGATITLRGGIGRYSGGSPNVWLSNNYSNDGISYLEILGNPGQSVVGGTLPARDFIAQNGFNLFPVPDALQDLLNAQSASGPVNALDPGFALPSIWRWNIGADVTYQGWQFSAEYMHMQALDQLQWVDLRTCEFGTLNCNAPDPTLLPAPDSDLGRVRYGTRTDRPAFSRDLMLTNRSEGEGQFIIFAGEKTWAFDRGAFKLNLGYVWSDVTDFGGGTASTADSNYQQRAVINLNDITVGRSEYERRHRYTMTADLKYEIFEGSPTKIRLFGQSTSGAPFSYVYNNNPFGGNGNNFRNLIYVPQANADGLVTATSDARVQFAPGFNLSAFNDYLQKSGLARYAGGIAPRNEFFGPWTTRFDLSVAQEIEVYEGHSVTLEFNIFNLGNLLNKDWGRYSAPTFFPTTGVVSGAIVPEGTVTDGVTCAQKTCYVYSGTIGDPEQGLQVRVPSSLWQIQLGIRYEF